METSRFRKQQPQRVAGKNKYQLNTVWECYRFGDYVCKLCVESGEMIHRSLWFEPSSVASGKGWNRFKNGSDHLTPSNLQRCGNSSRASALNSPFQFTSTWGHAAVNGRLHYTWIFTTPTSVCNMNTLRLRKCYEASLFLHTVATMWATCNLSTWQDTGPAPAGAHEQWIILPSLNNQEVTNDTWS